MTDNDLDQIYKIALPYSHYAGLRQVYDAGYQAGNSVTANSSTLDASLTASVPASNATVSTTNKV